MSSTQMANGYKPTTIDQNAQVAFYDQWLQLRDAVLADRHPHFKLPPSVKERLLPVSVPAPTTLSGSLSQLPGLSNNTNGTNASSGMQKSSATGQANAQAYAQNASVTEENLATKSGINPVLLTKSDDLIRAEIQLKRQRIERQLKEAVDQRKHVSRARDNEEAPPLTALTEILQKALEIVKPVSGLVSPANVQTAASDSFDENSYYSSQANDWSSEEGTPSSRQEEAAAATSQKPVVPASSASLSKKNHASEVEHVEEQLHPQSQSYDEPSYAYANDSEAMYDAEREDSEEYSPPAADAFSGPDGDADAMDLEDDSSEFVPQDAEVPSPQVPFVPNHLTQLAAPQPARVSPLTVTKVPGLGQHPTAMGRKPSSPRVQQPANNYHSHLVSDDSINSPRGSVGPSPAGSHKKKQRQKSKKRKREAEAATKARKTRNRPALSSPEPYIKPEPVSPPPMAGFSDLQPARVRPYQQPPPDVEIVAPPRQVYYQEPPPPQPSRYGYEGVPSPSVIRVASPAAYSRPRRDDQDLRRVASLHAAQQPISPAERTYSPAGYRTVSQPQFERQPRYQDEFIRPPQPQYVRSERSMSPPQLRNAREPYPQAMAPPPPPTRMIVTDQYGNRYYANEPEPQPLTRMSVAPQARPEPEVMYERAPSRQPVAYAPRTYQDELSMLPPPPPARRVTEHPEAAPVDYRIYRQREFSRAPEPQHYRQEAAPMYINAPDMRASAYPPDPASAGSYARAYSVRPEMEPVRYMSRQPSVAPQTEYVRVTDAGMRAPPPPSAPPMRAVSVMPGSEYGRAPEVRYGYGQPAGQYAAAGTRYVEEEGMRGSAVPREVFVDQYGREVTRTGY